MPRTARRKSETGIYHLILRGINRQTIFANEEDAIKFIQTLEKYQKKSEFKLYAYCLMSNHVHLLMKEEKEACLELDEKKKWKDQEAIELIKYVCQINHCNELQNLDREKQGASLKQLCTEGLSVRQISRITGIGRWVIQKAVKS